MNRKIFDIGSRNRFEYDDWFFNPRNMNKNPIFPPWLRAPSHYVGDVWRKVIYNTYGILYLNVLGNGVVVDLDCGHEAHIAEITIKMNPRIRAIYINCEKCGGTGEVRIN